MRPRARLVLTVVLVCVGCSPSAGDNALRRVVAPVGRNEDESVRLVAAAVDNIADQLAPSPMICLGIRDVTDRVELPSDRLLAAVRSDAVIAYDQCPTTYAGSLLSTDSLGNPVLPERPPGYVDPIRLTLQRGSTGSDTVLDIRFRYGQGPGGWFYVCPIPGPGVPVELIVCEKRGRWIG